MNPETIESFKIIGGGILVLVIVLLGALVIGIVGAFIDKFGHILIALILAGLGVGIICYGISLLFGVGGGAGAFGLIFLVPIGCVFFWFAYLVFIKVD